MSAGPRIRLPDPPDLSPPSDLLTADARAAIRQTLAGITGVLVGGVVAERASARTTCVTIDLTGWGPTLHAADGKLVLNLPAPPGVASVTRDEVEEHPALTRLTVIQRSRADAGLALGLSAPMDPTGGAVRLGPRSAVHRRMPTETRHLLVDASLPAVLATAGETPLADLVDGIRRMHESPGNLIHWGDAEGVHRDGDIWLQEIDASRLGLHDHAGTTLRIVGRAAVVEVPEGMTGSYDGRHLRISGHGLPETVISAMAGMRLGDVVAIHPALDDRTVEYAGADEDGELHVALLADLIPLSEADETAALMTEA